MEGSGRIEKSGSAQLIGEQIQAVRFRDNPLLPFFKSQMSTLILKQKEITEDDQKRRSFMNHSSIHSFNNTEKKNRIIRVINGRIFRNGKVGVIRCSNV